MRHANGAGGFAIHLARRKPGVVAADGHERGDAQLLQPLQHVLHARLGFGGVRPRRPQNRAAAKVDSGDFVDGQVHDVIRIALGEPLESVAEADHLESLVDAFDGGGADDAVDARGGSAAHQNCEFSSLASVCHIVFRLKLSVRAHYCAVRGSRAITVWRGDPKPSKSINARFLPRVLAIPACRAVRCRSRGRKADSIHLNHRGTEAQRKTAQCKLVSASPRLSGWFRAAPSRRKTRE